jgi:O-antigen/teichoic acid export membrane protein
MDDSCALGSESSTAGLLRRAFNAGTGRVAWDGLARSLSFLLTILLARSLGAEGYGAFAVAWYAAWMLSQATDLGLHLVTLRELSRRFEDRLLASAGAMKALLTLLVLSLAAAYHGAYPERSRLIGLLLATQLAGSWVELSGVVLRSRGLIAREGFLLATLRTGWLAAGLSIVTRGLGLEALASALFLSSLPALALAVALVSRARGEVLGKGLAPRLPSREDSLRVVKAALPLAATTAITLVYLRADLLIVAALRGPAEAGLFQSAFRLLEASFVLSGGIAGGTFPLLAARMGKTGFEGLSRFVLGLLLMVAVPLGCAFVLGAEPIVALVYGRGFVGAAPALAFLGVALVAVFVNAITTHLLVASGRTRRLVASMMVRLLVGIALDFLFVPAWGAAGAAAAVAAAEWSLLLASLLWAADLFGRGRLPQGAVTPQGASP